MKPLRYPEVNANTSQLSPLGDLVLVRLLPEKEKEASIVLPDIAHNPERGLRRGVVIACGPGDKVTEGWDVPGGRANTWKRHPMHVRPGDEIIFPRVPANVVNIGGEELILCHEQQHILAVIERDA